MQDNMYVKIYHNNTGQCFKDILMQEYMYVKNIPQRNRSMVQRHSNARVHKCKKLNVTSTVESFTSWGADYRGFAVFCLSQGDVISWMRRSSVSVTKKTLA